MLYSINDNFTEIPPPHKLAEVYGKVFQGGCTTPQLLEQLPGPLFVVSLAKEDFNHKDLFNEKKIVGLLWVGINDVGETLSDEQLLASTRMAAEAFENFFNLYIHCSAGISRSSYFNLAYHMYQYDMTYEKAFEHISKYRRIEPNRFLVEQLGRIERHLRLY